MKTIATLNGIYRENMIQQTTVPESRAVISFNCLGKELSSTPEIRWEHVRRGISAPTQRACV
jgi:hypothetical protein